MLAKRRIAQVIAAFDGIKPMAHALDLDPSTVFGWKKRGVIPRWHHDRILTLSRHIGRPLKRYQLGPRYAR